MMLTSALTMLLKVTMYMTSHDVEQLYNSENNPMIWMVTGSLFIIMIIASFVPVPIRVLHIVIQEGDDLDDFDVRLNVDVQRIYD